MKTKQLLIMIIFLGIVVNAAAQPLPPTTPNGNPIPVGGIMFIVFQLALFAFGIIKLRKKKG